jgi:hypothetical protein
MRHSFFYYLSLLCSLPPRAIGRRVAKRARHLAQRARAILGGTQLSSQAFQSALGEDIVGGERGLLERIHADFRPAFFVDVRRREETLAIFRRLCPDAEAAVLQAADAVCQHRFDLLGSGECILGQSIDWHTDFKSGHRWDPHTYYLDIQPAPYPGGFDIKVPWELSRCQHFAWLGQAYWLSGDEKYAREFRAQVEDWIECNPPQYGVNWACTMDVALRAVNWLWGYAFFRQSPALDDAFHLTFYRALLVHGRHIYGNLEWSEQLTSNHYLADLVGLVYLGFLAPEWREARRWRDFGLGELEKEMGKQVYLDGTGFEASTHYHRLSTELFLSAALLAEMNGHTFSLAFTERLERMLDVIRVIAHPDGVVAVMGDQDNGRVHRLKVWQPPEQEWLDFRPLLATGAAWRQNPVWAAAAGAHWEEAVWMLAPDAARVHVARAAAPAGGLQDSVVLPDGGWYVLQDRDFHLLVDLGPTGQNGYGGHAHNDSLSFDLFCQGQEWILDPGTYIYTQDYAARNRFRSTAMHNTVCLEGVEQNPYAAHNLFQMGAGAGVQALHWESNAVQTLLVGRVQAGGPAGWAHQRVFSLDPRDHALVIVDRAWGHPGRRRVTFCLAPGLAVTRLQAPLSGFCLGNEQGRRLWVLARTVPDEEITLGESEVSRGYGHRQPCSTASFTWPGEMPHTLVLAPFAPGPEQMSRAQAVALQWGDFELPSS